MSLSFLSALDFTEVKYMKIINDKISLKSKTVKTLAIVLGIAISFMGNPVKIHFAKNAAVEYVKEKYPEHDLEVQRVNYNFKFDEYAVEMQDKNSADIKFTVNYKNSKTPLTDDYGYKVENVDSMITRLEAEACEEIKPYMQVFAQENSMELGDRCFILFGTVEQDEIPPLHTKFSKELGLKGEIYVDFITDSDLNIEQATEKFKGVYKTLTDEGYIIVNVNIYITMPDKTISLSAEDKFINDDLAETFETLLNGEAYMQGVYADLFLE